MVHDSLGIVGTTIDQKYVIEKAVGEGSFSVVYRAQHLIWRGPVALKCFKGFGDVAEDVRAQLLADFVQEGRLLSELSGRDATIVQARDAGWLVSEGQETIPYIVLEWLEGRTLASVLDEQRAIFGVHGWPFAKAIEVLAPVATALGMVHRRGIAHRDIKPDNIWIAGTFDSEDMRVKLLDFGIAKVVSELRTREFRQTKEGVKSFTPGYAAPEQFSRALGATGPWTDVYALALVLIELLVGRPPTEGEDFIQLGMAAVDPERRPTPRALGTNVSDELERVLARAVSVRPEERFPTAREFWEAIVATHTSSPLAARPHESLRRSASSFDATVKSGQSATVKSGQSLPPRIESRQLSQPPVAVIEPQALDDEGEEIAHATRRPWGRRIAGGLACCAVVAGIAYRGPRKMATELNDAVTSRLTGLRLSWSHSAEAHSATALPAPSASVSVPPSCSNEMASVFGATFLLGTGDVDAEPGERLVREVTLSPFCIDRKEVTVGAYSQCVEQGRCDRAPYEVEWRGIAKDEKKALSSACNGDDPERNVHPVNCVDWNMATRYCAFVGKRLPTEAEWELAARGTDGRLYPWGDDPPDATRANACGRECVGWAQKNAVVAEPMYREDDGYPLTAPVGSFPRGRSPYGVLDMVGNVGEWVSDWEGPYGTAPELNPTGPSRGTRRIVRGGAFNGASPSWVRSTRRHSDFPETRSHAYGFRCAKPLPR